MTYNLVYTRRAKKDIPALDPAIKRQIGKAILKLQSNPTEQSEKLQIRESEHTDSEQVITE
jgi:mRNA-degrading endonuclease RelE of RelBE toxin-antitoxin system